MGEERKFDIEEYVMKAEAFHKDKERAEKLSKKKGYLNSLCSKLEEKIFFKCRTNGKARAKARRKVKKKGGTKDRRKGGGVNARAY